METLAVKLSWRGLIRLPMSPSLEAKPLYSMWPIGGKAPKSRCTVLRQQMNENGQYPTPSSPQSQTAFAPNQNVQHAGLLAFALELKRGPVGQYKAASEK